MTSSYEAPSLTTSQLLFSAAAKAVSEASKLPASAVGTDPLLGPAPKRISKSLEVLNCGAMWSSFVEELVLVKGEKGLGFSILDYQVISIYIVHRKVLLRAHAFLFPLRKPLFSFLRESHIYHPRPPSRVAGLNDAESIFMVGTWWGGMYKECYYCTLGSV